MKLSERGKEGKRKGERGREKVREKEEKVGALYTFHHAAHTLADT